MSGVSRNALAMVWIASRPSLLFASCIVLYTLLAGKGLRLSGLTEFVILRLKDILLDSQGWSKRDSSQHNETILKYAVDLYLVLIHRCCRLVDDSLIWTRKTERPTLVVIATLVHCQHLKGRTVLVRYGI